MKVLETQDGSSTILSSAFNVTYHSRFGAIQESQHVFIQNGLLPVIQRSPSKVKILEVGFGTGLNLLLTHLITRPKCLPLIYTTLDLLPLKNELLQQINYVSQLKLNNNYKLFFRAIHEFSWDYWHQVDEFTELKKQLINLIDYQPPSQHFNLIYFDAFAPTAQPELWEPEILERIFESLEPEGILVTYCAKGSVKRIFKRLGGQVESIPGPPGKREMIRVIKSI